MQSVYTQLMVLRRWFVLIILVAFSVSFAQREVFEACAPAVGKVVVNGSPHPAISERVRVIFNEDQKARTGEDVDWEVLNRGDTARRTEVMDYLEQGQLSTGVDLYYAAFIFQHGNCPEHYKLANRLAGKAISLDYNDARWIYAATLDRYLLSRGKKQKFGTQYTSTDGCTYVLEPVNPKTTDKERRRYDVPPLAQAKAAVSEFGSDGCRSRED